MPSQSTYNSNLFSNQISLEYSHIFSPDSSGKEKDSETGYHYFGARYYNSDLSLWLSVDPMSDKYPSLSPYNYCAWNPMKLVDPDGAKIRVTDKQSQQNIRYSLTKHDAKHVRFDKNGNLLANRLNRHKSNSTNFNVLKALSNSSTEYVFSTATSYKDSQKEVELSGSPNEGVRGVTLMPGNLHDPSPDDNVYIITSSKLSEGSQVENLAHEGYGHAYFYELKQNGEDVNPNHEYSGAIIGSEWDPEVNRNCFNYGIVDKNVKLINQIETAVSEARQNYQSWKE